MAERKPTKPTQKKQAGRPADVRGALVSAARDELMQHGAMGLSVRAVARHVGVSHQATVHYFGDRAGLLTAVAIQGLSDLGQQLTRAVEGLSEQAGPLERIVVMGVAYSRFAAEHAPLMDVMFSEALTQAGADELQVAQLAVWHQLLAEFEEASEAGFGGGADAQGLAVAAWAFVHGLATLSRGPIGIVAGGLPMEAVVTNLAVAVGVRQQPPDPGA